MKVILDINTRTYEYSCFLSFDNINLLSINTNLYEAHKKPKSFSCSEVGYMDHTANGLGQRSNPWEILISI